MKYLPNQPAKYCRLDRPSIELISTALAQHAARISNTTPLAARQARIMRRALPKSLPYELSCLAQEWEILSQALRPEGSNPTPGSEAARMFALYTKLRRVFVFATEGMEARLRAAKRSGFRRLGKM
jgi:hypothetical protein